MSVGHGNLPYTEVSRHGREIFTKRQGKNVPAVISGRDFRFRDAPSAQQRRKKQHDGEDVEKRNGDRIRESVQDDFIDNVAAGADRVPAVNRFIHQFLHLDDILVGGIVRCVGLPAVLKVVAEHVGPAVLKF